VYNPYVGRFMQTDPSRYSDGINWYAYVKNNPINYIDPSSTCTSLQWCVKSISNFCVCMASDAFSMGDI